MSTNINYRVEVSKIIKKCMSKAETIDLYWDGIDNDGVILLNDSPLTQKEMCTMSALVDELHHHATAFKMILCNWKDDTIEEQE